MNDTVAAAIWALLGLATLAFGALFELEAYLYLTRQPPITHYIRNWGYGHTFVFVLIGILLVAGVSAAVTHFVLDGPSSYR